MPSEFLPHSCHCYFLLAGSSSIPILFHVERVRDGRSFATRTVQARQRGRCIFTTTISFARTDSDEPSKKKKMVSHAAGWPQGDLPPPPADDDPDLEFSHRSSSPFESGRIETHRGTDPSAAPQDRRCRTWMRAKGRISDEGGHQAHLNALAYMSDSYFIGTVSRIHGLWRFPFTPGDVLGKTENGESSGKSLSKEQAEAVRRAMEFEGMGTNLEEWEGRPQVGMLVSLDHSIYFHEPTQVRADEWMFSEMESPWAGEERGVVTQRIFAKDGTLLASCMQEGVVRLKQDGSEKGAKL